MDPADPVVPAEPLPAASSRRKAKLAGVLVIALAVAAAGLLLLRQRGSAPGAAVSSASPDAGTPAGLNAVAAPVKLSPEATLVADRFKCLCGDCQDTLGKCTCTRDKGSNDMKTALNRNVVEKKTLAEIEAAMVEKFGPKVLAVEAAPAPSPAKR